MNLLLTTLLAFVVIALVVLGMSVGVMAGRQPIKGSCGGVSGSGCELCAGKRCRKADSR